MRLASLAMYVSPPPVASATDALWAFIRDRLVDRGIEDVPVALDRSVAYDQAWLEPNLLLSQACGLPYAKRLRGRAQLVATPVYDIKGCEGPSTRSFIIVRSQADVASLADLRGLNAAINDRDSNSGTNLFRAAIAPLAHGGRFFSSVIETGGHLASIAAVVAGQADVAAIDCVTFGNTKRFEPARLEGLRVLAETEQGPGLPFITGPRTTEGELQALRSILAEAIASPALAAVRDVLSLRRFDVLTDADYERLSDLESRAAALGYPEIA